MNDRPVNEFVDRLGKRISHTDLSHLEQMIRALHIGNEKVIVTIAIDVSEVHRHRKVAAMPDRLFVNQLKPAITLVYPEPIRRLEIVAVVNIRQAVLIDVPNHYGQTEIPKLLLQRLPIFIQPIAVEPIGLCKLRVAVVDVEKIRLAHLNKISVHNSDTIRVLTSHHLLAIDNAHRYRAAAA